LHTAACARPQHAPTRQIYSTPLSLSLYTFFICNFFLCCRHCCVDEEMSARCSSFFCHSEPAQPASSRAPSLVQGAVVTVRVCVCVCVCVCARFHKAAIRRCVVHPGTASIESATLFFLSLSLQPWPAALSTTKAVYAALGSIAFFLLKYLLSSQVPFGM